MNVAHQALAAKLAETDAPGGWRAFRPLVPPPTSGTQPGTSSGNDSSSGGGGISLDRDQRLIASRPISFEPRDYERPLDAVAALRPGTS
jgi:hypothetical protein